ncbi:hypothetical protein PVAG01_03186 [Phlyctema vagabunda]|uniref:Uncharacterized protein n=1 Tax=Phlyctema vagabunda TaxID=108571 RepID=A0ABR4PT40_9HELO
MASATDIITYIGVPLAVLGVLPIIYVTLGTVFTRWKVKRSLCKHDLAGQPVHARYLSGFVTVEIPSFELAPLPREDPRYWELQETRLKGYRSTIDTRTSWRLLPWNLTPFPGEEVRLHYTDPLEMPEARISFSTFLEYLGDLGVQTNRAGFWDLRRGGLKTRPGTCLVEEKIHTGMASPFLVVAPASSRTPGVLLLKFEKRSIRLRRTREDIEPHWIPVLPEKRGTDEKGVHETSAEGLTKYTHLKIGCKGIIEARSASGQTNLISGIRFWFTYALLSSIGSSDQSFHGHPFGFNIRTKSLYIARECVVPISGPISHPRWYEIFLGLIDAAKLDEIPADWTSDSTARQDVELTRRFELLVPTPTRNRSAAFRRNRIRAKAFAERKLANLEMKGDTEAESLSVPLETLSLTDADWQRACEGLDSKVLYPLDATRLPQIQELCIMACENETLASLVFCMCNELYDWFTGKGDVAILVAEPTPVRICALYAAVLLLQAVAANTAYLAALSDVEECTRVWELVYLC